MLTWAPDYTGLALSSYQRDVEDSQGDQVKRFERYWKYYNRALIELRQYMDDANHDEDEDYNFNVSFCILQLIYCEVKTKATLLTMMNSDET
jgi:hypothetical protein